MARAQVNRPYKWLAEYYDRMAGPFREAMDAARKQALSQILPKVRSACDLACGTGTAALVMARGGVRMLAVDLSADMCRAAREKARRGRVPLQVIRADMRRFRLPERVDLITCEGDALNHIPRKTDLRLVARAAARALKPGGYFYFDVNNRAGFAAYWKGVQWLEWPGVVLAMRNGNDARNDHAWCDVEWFVKEGSLWRRRRERVDEVCWSAAEIRSTLRDAGFDRVREWDATPFFKDNPLMVPGCRSVYLARKAAGSR